MILIITDNCCTDNPYPYSTALDDNNGRQSCQFWAQSVKKFVEKRPVKIMEIYCW